MVHVIDDFEGCYRFMQSRDPRYDGFFFVGVTSTGVYCRPSCPARLPYRQRAPGPWRPPSTRASAPASAATPTRLARLEQARRSGGTRCA